MERAICVASMGMVLAFACGCQTTVPIRLGNLPEPTSQVRGKIAMLSKAADARKTPSDKIGRHTISLLMIPGPGVYSQGEHVEDVVAGHCRTGLEKVGYSVETVNSVDATNAPVLVPQINLIRNYSFTWLWPLGLTFGKMRLSLVLYGTNNQVVWKKDLSGKSGFMASLVYISGFGTAVKTEMTGSVKEVMKVCASPEFLAAVEQASEGK